MRSKTVLIFLLAALLVSGCGRLESIPYSPPTTPQAWLASQPYLEFSLGGETAVLVQPSTSAIVYLLGLIAIGAGLFFLRIRGQQRARLWWGIALLLWGIGALLAGTSYEAFSYAIKCAGRETCLWTSWWEVAYLLLSAASVNAMLLAESYTSVSGRWRRVLTIYALVNTALYLAALAVGSLLPVKFLISFELLLVFCAPSVALFLFLNTWRYRKYRQPLDLALLRAWTWLVLTIGAYFAYYISGLTQTLWQQGIWFSENDVLHIGLIVWMVYLALAVAPHTQDLA